MSAQFLKQVIEQKQAAQVPPVTIGHPIGGANEVNYREKSQMVPAVIISRA